MTAVRKSLQDMLEWGSEKWVMDQFKQIGELIRSGDEQAAADIVEFNFGNHSENGWTNATVLSVVWDMFKDPVILFRLFVGVYVNDGYFFPRKLIMKAKKLSKQIPDEERLKGLPDGNPVYLYRATATPADKAKYEPSWTTDKETAIQFSQRGRMYGNGALPILTGIIERNKIIAYTNQRNEKEVLQYRNVFVTGTYTPTEEEIQYATRPKRIDWWNEESEDK